MEKMYYIFFNWVLFFYFKLFLTIFFLVPLGDFTME